MLVLTACFALLHQSPYTRTDPLLPCRITKVISGTRIEVQTKGSRRVDVSLESLSEAPKRHWAYAACRRFLEDMRAWSRHETPSRLWLRIDRKQPGGQVIGELIDQPEPGVPQRYALSERLLEAGLVRLTHLYDTRAELQKQAQDSAHGIWTRRLLPIKKGDGLNGGVIQATSPTEFRVLRFGGDNYNTWPALKVRVYGLVPAPRSSPVYSAAMQFAMKLVGRITKDDWSGKIDVDGGLDSSFQVLAIDKSGTALCHASYNTYSPDTPDGMFRCDGNEYEEELLVRGFAKIDPHATDVPESWTRCESSAREQGLGVWAHFKNAK